MLYGKILRSPHAHARVKSIDITAAQKAPGVRSALATIQTGQKVMYAGEEIAAVAALTEQQAGDAVRMIRVEWEVLPHLATVEQAMRPEAPKVFEPNNTRTGNTEEEGDVDAGLKAAAHLVEGTYSTQVQTHTSLETHGCVCEWNGEQLTAWVSTQAVHGTRDGFASGPQDPAGQRARHHRVHGRRLRQQVRSRRAGADLCAAREGCERAGQDDARSQGRASRDRQPSIGVRAGQGWRGRRRHADPLRRAVVGHRRRRAPAPDFRCPTSTSSPIAAAPTPTSTSTPACSARCARPAIRKAASSPKS